MVCEAKPSDLHSQNSSVQADKKMHFDLQAVKDKLFYVNFNHIPAQYLYLRPSRWWLESLVLSWHDREGQSINEELYTYKNNKKLKSATTHLVFLPQIRMNRWWIPSPSRDRNGSCCSQTSPRSKKIYICIYCVQPTPHIWGLLAGKKKLKKKEERETISTHRDFKRMIVYKYLFKFPSSFCEHHY